MRLETFARTCGEFFRGWSHVETFVIPTGDMCVQLTCSGKRMEAARADAGRLIGELLDRTKLEDLAKRIEQHSRNGGLHRYGRPRRLR